MWYQSATNTLAFQVMAEDQKRIISSTENVPLNEFSCYAYSYNGTDANIYINGTVKATQSWPSYAGTNLTSNLKTYLGSQSPSVRPLKGIMDDTVFVNRTLSDDQIEQWCLGNTNFIVSDETKAGEIWQAEMIPNDRSRDGEIKSSNTLLIRRVVELVFGYGGSQMKSANYNVTQTLVEVPMEHKNSTSYNATLLRAVYN